MATEQSLITPEMEKRLNDARDLIARGALGVSEYAEAPIQLRGGLELLSAPKQGGGAK